MGQNRVHDSLFTVQLLQDGSLLTIVVLITFRNYGRFVNKAQLVGVLGKLSRVDAKDVLLVERLGPPLWDAVLDLVLHGDFVGGTGQSLGQ